MDTLGHLLALVVTPANAQDRAQVAERTFSWLGRSRRLSKDYERLPASGEAVRYVVGSRLLLARLN